MAIYTIFENGESSGHSAQFDPENLPHMPEGWELYEVINVLSTNEKTSYVRIDHDLKQVINTSAVHLPGFYEVKTSESLDLAKMTACAFIDQAVGNMRMRYITDAPAQDMVYDQKRQEAEAVAANPAYYNQHPAEVPYIARGAARNGLTLLGEASDILIKWYTTKEKLSIIDDKKQEAKDVINAATTRAEIEAAMLIDWSDL